jgi:hypothetical protein
MLSFSGQRHQDRIIANRRIMGEMGDISQDSRHDLPCRFHGSGAGGVQQARFSIEFTLGILGLQEPSVYDNMKSPGVNLTNFCCQAASFSMPKKAVTKLLPPVSLRMRSFTRLIVSAGRVG